MVPVEKEIEISDLLDVSHHEIKVEDDGVSVDVSGEVEHSGD